MDIKPTRVVHARSISSVHHLTHHMHAHDFFDYLRLLGAVRNAHQPDGGQQDGDTIHPYVELSVWGVWFVCAWGGRRSQGGSDCRAWMLG